MKENKTYFILLFCFVISVSFCQTKTVDDVIDTIVELRQKSKDFSYSIEERLRFARQSSDLARTTELDSTILFSDKVLAYVFFSNEDYEPYAKITRSNIALAKKIRDTLEIALTTQNLGGYFELTLKNDSAFYYYSKALKDFRSMNNEKKQSEVLRNISLLQEKENDYISSEQNAIEAIKIINTLKLNDDLLEDLWILNNNVASIALELKEYDKSLDYHNRALSISKKQKGLYSFWNGLYSLNNMCTVYRKKHDYDKALELYHEALEKGGDFKEDYVFYAIINHNIAYTKFLRGDPITDDLIRDIKKSYKISDSLNDPITKSAIAVELAKVYHKINQKDSALFYARHSKDVALQVSNNEYLLDAYLLLSELEEGEQGKKYLRDHIKLSDSLIEVERAVRNKFARIQYETEQIEQENKEISEQRKWLLILSGGLLLTLVLLYIIITQRSKNKELQFIQEQQEANEEIYNLMLSQQDKIDEARTEEKRRISQELHDGVLGRLFGTRLSLDSLNINPSPEAVKTRGEYIDQLKDIEQDIRKVSHDLNTDFVSGSGFVDIITTLIENQCKAYELEYELNHSDDINWDSVPNKTKIHVYRMLQESLQNIYKHANASKVNISFEKKNDVICLTVTDDGDGFDTNKSRKGIGIKNFNSRVKEINGKLNINSEIGKGTEVEIIVPV